MNDKHSDKVMAAMAQERAEAMTDGATCPVCKKQPQSAEPLDIEPLRGCKYRLRAYRAQCRCAGTQAAYEVVQYLKDGGWVTAQYRVTCGEMRGPWDYTGEIGFDVSDSPYTPEEKEKRYNEVIIACEAVKHAIDNLAEAIHKATR